MTTRRAGGGPVVEMAHVVASHQSLVHTLRRFDRAVAGAPSLLPGWTRAHVVAHLAANAEAQVRMLEGAMADQVVDQYPGGAEGRAKEIDRRARRSASRLVDDFVASGEALFEVWERMPDEAWDRPTGAISGTRPARRSAWARWREQEIHHVDLDLGFGPDDWPAAFVLELLPRLIMSLPDRRPAEVGGQRVSWLLESTDDAGSWLVVDDGRSTTVRPVVPRTDDDVRAGVIVRGDGARLAAWLLGRYPLARAGLEVEGSVEPDLDLPARHPFP